MADLPFSACRRVGDTLHLSGTIGFEPDGSLAGDITRETNAALTRIEKILKSEGFAMSDVVSATCFLTDKADFTAFNAAYRTWFADPLPVRSTVVCNLVVDAKVEIAVIAAKDAAA